MAVTAQFNKFHTTAGAGDNDRGFLSRLLTRITLVGEARAIHRLETEAAHLLDSGQLRQIKANFAARKAQTLK